MKLLLLSMIISAVSMADSFEFKCIGPEQIYMNSFSMSGFTETQDDKLLFDIQLRENGYEGESYEFRAVEMVANHQMINSVLHSSAGIKRIYAVDKDSEIAYVNILLDYPGQFTSQVRLRSGRTFKSSCKTL